MTRGYAPVPPEPHSSIAPRFELEKAPPREWLFYCAFHGHSRSVQDVTPYCLGCKYPDQVGGRVSGRVERMAIDNDAGAKAKPKPRVTKRMSNFCEHASYQTSDKELVWLCRNCQDDVPTTIHHYSVPGWPYALAGLITFLIIALAMIFQLG